MDCRAAKQCVAHRATYQDGRHARQGAHRLNFGLRE